MLQKSQLASSVKVEVLFFFLLETNLVDILCYHVKIFQSLVQNHELTIETREI